MNYKIQIEEKKNLTESTILSEELHKKEQKFLVCLYFRGKGDSPLNSDHEEGSCLLRMYSFHNFPFSC